MALPLHHLPHHQLLRTTPRHPFRPSSPLLLRCLGQHRAGRRATLNLNYSSLTPVLQKMKIPKPTSSAAHPSTTNPRINVVRALRHCRPSTYLKREPGAGDEEGDLCSKQAHSERYQTVSSEGDWSDSKEAQLLRRATAVRMGRQRGWRKPFKVRSARGTATSAPARWFFVFYTSTFHKRRLGTMLVQGVGAGRLMPQPTSLAACTNEAAQTDLTGHFLSKMQRYATSRSVLLSQFTVRQSISLSTLTALMFARYSTTTLQTWHDLLNRDSTANTVTLPIMTTDTHGFGLFRVPTSSGTLYLFRDAVQSQSRVITAIGTGEQWWGVEVDVANNTLTVRANASTHLADITSELTEWCRLHGISRPPVTTDVCETWDVAQWLVVEAMEWAPEYVSQLNFA
eukprot:3940424-Rhodomonas_salina.1